MIVGRIWVAKITPKPPSPRPSGPKTNSAPAVVKLSTSTKNELTHEKKAAGQPSGAKTSPIARPLRMRMASTIWSPSPVTTVRQLMARRFSERRRAMPRMTLRPRRPRRRPTAKSMGGGLGEDEAPKIPERPVSVTRLGAISRAQPILRLLPGDCRPGVVRAVRVRDQSVWVEADGRHTPVAGDADLERARVGEGLDGDAHALGRPVLERHVQLDGQ